MSDAAAPQPLGDNRTDRLGATDWCLIVVLVLVTCALYFRVLGFDFIDYDDQLYVYSNVHVEQGATLSSMHWALNAQLNGNWHPLTTLTQLFVCSIFGLKAGAYHGLNMLLHVMNATLLYLFFRRSTGRIWPAFFTALLWGLHPLRVESVAWISELKDVLCGVFWLGCMLVYLRYSRRRTIVGLALVTLLQTLALLAKPMAVTLPCALLLLDYWPLGRSDSSSSTLRWWTFRVLEKLPMLGLSIVDILKQKNPISFSSQGLPFLIRIENGIVSYAIYLGQTFFPRHLGIFYPHPGMLRHPGDAAHIPWIQIVVSATALLLVSAAVFLRIRKQPFLAVGWCWFLGTLIPVIGLTQVGEQARADRFTYLPSIGIFMAIVWGISDLCASQSTRRRAAAIAGCVTAAVFLLQSSWNLSYWKNTDTLFGHLLEIQPDNYLALAVTCDKLSGEGHTTEAIALGRKAIGISPGSPRAHNSYGNALRLAGEYDKAAEQFQLSTRLDPNNPATWDTLGRVRDAQAGAIAGRDGPMENKYRLSAIADFRNAIKAEPDEIIARDHLAFQLAVLGRFDEAIPVWEQTIALSPGFAQAHGDLADALLRNGDQPGAIQHYRAALAAGSKYAPWETNLAYLIATSPEATGADVQPMIAIAKDACDQTKNQDPAALDAYGACLARAGVFGPAVDAAQQGIAAANAAHNPAVANGIEKHLSFYLKNQPFIKAVETSQPATTQSTR